LIEDLLDRARADGGALSFRPRRVCARELLRDAVESQKPLLSSAALALDLELPPELPEVVADSDRVREILSNLIGNAVKFSVRGGRVTVGAAAETDTVRFWVADNGIGISAEDAPRVFDRYWQARHTGQSGVGLGLSIVRGIVQAHGGRLWVESALGRGARFLFTLPVAAPDVPPKSSGPVPVRRRTESARVLVIDDDRVALQALQILLSNQGYVVDVAANVADGVAKLSSFRPDLVLVDETLPDGRGSALIRGLRERDGGAHGARCVLMSGYDFDREALGRARAQAFIRKPIDINSLRALVERMLAS
jgi:CheY-like chemotaxis protein